MLRKLVVAGAVAAAAAGFGLASPAYGDDLVEVACVGPTFGAQTNTTESGIVTGAVTSLGGDVFSNLLHDESTTRFDHACGNGAIRRVGNTTVTVGRPDTLTGVFR